GGFARGKKVGLLGKKIGRNLCGARGGGLRPAKLPRAGAGPAPAPVFPCAPKKGPPRRPTPRAPPPEPPGAHPPPPVSPRRERPRGRRAAEQRDELAALHSITSSARASRLSGTVSPSALAV